MSMILKGSHVYSSIDLYREPILKGSYVMPAKAFKNQFIKFIWKKWYTWSAVYGY